MRLLKDTLIGKPVMRNIQTGDFIGKCLNKNEYWYYDTNMNLIKKSSKRNVYYL